MSTLTKCCNSEVVRHFGKEYPDGPIYYIAVSWPACNACNDEWPDTYEEEEED